MMTRSWMARGLVRPRWRGSKGCRHCLRQTRSVCARERSDEAIHGFASGKMDGFASLAMANIGVCLLDLLIRRAEIGQRHRNRDRFLDQILERYLQLLAGFQRGQHV